ncbi:hypothetical protein HGRIS_012997 [Hohenbuehelia grisea]|uniref:BTB domain-containing protein n=1 Tax=Hohenbuehelia grisea TaxID=104357 RepID=A0ABR3IU97_9AGAR
MASFAHRAFPPPSLSGVPVEYIIDQLHNLAHCYWNKPDTADCTIVVPIPHRSKNTHRFPPGALQMPGHSLGRRVSEPAFNQTPQLSMKLHVDYLAAHSTFLRALFCEASPIDLITSSESSTPSASSSSSTSPFNVPADRMPRLLPASTPAHPVLFLPVPDPSSFHLLIHWMYFGSTEYIAEALSDGSIQWEGIARNVEYLGLPADIKVFLGRWYGNWLHPERARAASDNPELDYDSDTAYDSDDEDECLTASDSDELEEDDDPKEELHRGRTRETRRLSSNVSWTESR